MQRKNGLRSVLLRKQFLYGIGDYATSPTVWGDWFWPATESNPDVTVNLSGQAVTSAAGSVTTSRTLTVSGQAIAVSLGTISPQLAVALLGQAGTLAAGTLSPATALALSGQDGTFAAGTINVSIGGNVTVSLTGEAIGLGVGTLSYGLALSATGHEVSSATGNLSLSGLVLVSGQSGTWDSGTLSPTLAVALAGSSVSAALGTISASGASDVTVNLSGQDLSTASGLLTIASSIALSGQLGVFSGASLSPSGGSSLAWTGDKFYVYVVSTYGKIKWTQYIPVKYITLSNGEQVNRYNDGGALAVTTLSSVTGLTEWVDYIPVAVNGTRDWRFDDDGLIRVVEVS